MNKALFIGAMLAALLPSAAFGQHACLRMGQIYNWNAINDKTLIVEDEVHRKFKLNLVGVCSNLKFDRSLAFESRGGLQISCLEAGDEVVSHESDVGPERCAVTHIEAYTPDMEHADHAAAQAAKDQRTGY